MNFIHLALVIRVGGLEENGKSNDQDEIRYHFVIVIYNMYGPWKRSNSII